MKRRISVDKNVLNKNVWIYYAIFKNENGTEDNFQFENDFIYEFGITEDEAKEKLKNTLLKRDDVFETDFEAFF